MLPRSIFVHQYETICIENSFIKHALMIGRAFSFVTFFTIIRFWKKIMFPKAKTMPSVCQMVECQMVEFV